MNFLTYELDVLFIVHTILFLYVFHATYTAMNTLEMISLRAKISYNEVQQVHVQ